jgi:arylformamidase
LSQPWIDVTVPLRDGLVHWPGDPRFAIERVAEIERGDPATVSKLTMGVHTGTHMDAPAHYLRGGTTIDALPLDATVGPARVIAISDPESIKPAELRSLGVRRGERLLFRTRNSGRRWTQEAFIEDFVYLAADAARLLADRGVRCVGVDYLSVGGFHRDGRETHEALLAVGVWIIEGLDLSAVEPGRYELICLPLRIVGAEGAPARALLRPLAAGRSKQGGAR